MIESFLIDIHFLTAMLIYIYVIAISGTYSIIYHTSLALFCIYSVSIPYNLVHTINFNVYNLEPLCFHR
jgi:hypothetical protein